MPIELRSGKVAGVLGIRKSTNKLCKKPRRLVHFPFFELPPELCVRILRYLRKVEITPSGFSECGCFREARLVCQTMNNLIGENRATIGPMLVQRLFVGQHHEFDQGPKRFVVPDTSKLLNHLSSCAHSYSQQAFFYKVSFEAPAVKTLIRELRCNHVHIRGMIFYGVVFDCDANLLVELFEASRIVCLVMIECQLPGDLAENLARHEFIATMKSHFIGRIDSFWYYRGWLLGSQDDEWLKWFIEFTFPSVTPPVREEDYPPEDESMWRIWSIRHEPLRSAALNIDYCIYVFMFYPGVVSYFESFSMESSYRRLIGVCL